MLKYLINLFIKKNGRAPNAIEMLKLKFKASSMKEGQILKGDFSKGDSKKWMDRVSDAFVKSTKAKNKEAAYNMALKRYESVDRKFLPQKQIENIYRDLAKDSRGREIILRDIGEIEKREMFTTMSNQMRQDILSKLRGLSYKPNPFKNKPTGKKDPNFDPDPTGMASGGIAGQLHLNEGGRVGLQEGGLPTVESLGGRPNVEGGEIVYNLGNGQYIYKSSQGFELVDENGVYTSLGAHQWTDEEGTHGWANLDDLLDSGVVMRRANDPVLLTQQQTAPATLTAQAPATNMVNEEISWEPGQAAPEGYEVKRALGDEWIQRVEPSMPPVGPVELPPGVPGLMGPVPPTEMMPPVLPIPPEQAATMEATPTGLTSVTPQKTVTQNPLVDPRMYRSYEQNIQLMGDPRTPQASGGLAKILGV